MNERNPGVNSLSLSFAEQLLADYLRDPSSVPPDWRAFFATLDPPQARSVSPVQLRPSFRPASIFHGGTGPAGNGHRSGNGDGAAPTVGERRMGLLQDRLDQLVRAYRVRGHMEAKLDPLRRPREPVPALEPSYYGFTEEDYDRHFSSRTVAGTDNHTLREIVQRMRNTYCRSIGVQFMHIDDLEIRHWLQDRMEGCENRVKLGRVEQIRILTLLTQAVVFEEFIQKKYVGAKSFSLEGSESLIPLLSIAIQQAAGHGVQEIVLAMAHRGRLNVLANIMSKPPQDIFREFDDVDPQQYNGRGDVKYHLGYSSDWESGSGQKVHLSLCFNPSHLEFINPVAIGRMRAKMDRCGDGKRERGMVLLIHGDAGFAGQGVIQETLNLSELRGYRVGGTIHVIVNNQIGFTTSPEDGRSTEYASAVAKMLQIPIFHVNGEDPEAVSQVVMLAIDFRRKFRRDVVIDMYGYRRFGHNEGDEPSFTQPLLYRAIGRRKRVRDGYVEHLLKLGGVTREQAEGIEALCRENLEQALGAARSSAYVRKLQSMGGIWNGYVGGPAGAVPEVDTSVEPGRLSSLLERLAFIPDGFHLHPKLERWIKARQEMAAGERPLDWAAGEALAFATLATEGIRVRMSGQDSERGTFSHRHAVLHDYEDGNTYVPLRHLAPNQASVRIYNSPLSEVGVLGFEYGYSLDCPDGLVIWEAQFGDFCNVAQVILDQFIVSAEDKWRRLSGLVMLLPHSFEGQGPEHASARLERFLTLAAEDNIQVCNCTTPAQYFHLLRRQVLRKWRKPLVLMAPKSMLRHPRAVSALEDLASGGFRPVLADGGVDPARVRRVLLCSGKLYYELLEHRESTHREDVAILRLEQLYPLCRDALGEALAPYADGTQLVWVQEEPENMGAWKFIRDRYGDFFRARMALSGVCRPESASPATGSSSSHKLEQKLLIDTAFAEGDAQ